MSSSTEQLIRDYLNRLSGAARGQLGAGDRRALVDRTREFIERKTDLGSRPTALEVGKLLSGLGDPARLVSQERERLATLRGEPPEPVSRGHLVRVLRGEPGKARGGSWHWPVQPGSRTGSLFAIFDGGGPPAGREATAGAAAGREAGRPVAAEAPAQLVPGGQAPSPDPAQARPVWPTLTAGTAEAEAVDPGTAEREGGQHEIVDGEVVDSDAGERGAGQPEADHQAFDDQALDQQALDQQALGPDAPAPAPDARPVGLAGMNWQLVTLAPRRSSRSRQRLASAGEWSRDHKLETAAITLLGLGGAIFPLIWLLGAAVALASRFWDHRDKWLGLGLPVLVTVVGTAVGISVGGQVSFGHSMHEGWAFAVDVSRATAVLSACYLAWRAARGPRPPAVPPWDRPHRAK